MEETRLQSSSSQSIYLNSVILAVWQPGDGGENLKLGRVLILSKVTLSPSPTTLSSTGIPCPFLYPLPMRAHASWQSQTRLGYRTHLTSRAVRGKKGSGWRTSGWAPKSLLQIKGGSGRVRGVAVHPSGSNVFEAPTTNQTEMFAAGFKCSPMHLASIELAGRVGGGGDGGFIKGGRSAPCSAAARKSERWVFALFSQRTFFAQVARGAMLTVSS